MRSRLYVLRKMRELKNVAFSSMLSFPRRRESSRITYKGMDVRIKFDNDEENAFYFLLTKNTVGFHVSYIWVLWIPAYAGMTKER